MNSTQLKYRLRQRSLQMKETKSFNFAELQKAIRPFCKTSSLNGLFTIKLKSKNQGIIFKTSIFGNETFFTVVSYKQPDLIYELWADNNKQLLEKILNHNLL